MKRALNFMNKALPITYNTYIGGVSASISTDALLATKLAISVGAISNFTIVGSDVKCKITGSYAIPALAFRSTTTPCTYYYDFDYLVTSIGMEAFYNTNNFNQLTVDFQNATSLGSSSFYLTNAYKYLFKNAITVSNNCFQSNTKADLYYIPSCTALGVSALTNAVFTGIKAGVIIYANPALATNNGGAPDGDLTTAIGLGAIVKYVSNYTAPSAVTDLSIGTIKNTCIQLNFTPPSSANALDYYEVYFDGVYYQKIKAAGDYVVNLTQNTSYIITIKAVDIYYNLSGFSNEVTQTTLNTGVLTLQEKVKAMYKMEDVLDYKNKFHGIIGSATTFSAGKNGNGGVFNGTTNSRIKVDLSGITGLTKASVSFWVKLNTHIPATIPKCGVLGVTTEPGGTTYYPYTNASIFLSILTSVRKNCGAGVIADRTQWHMVTITANTVSNVWKFYQNGTLVTTSTVGTFAFTSIGFLGGSSDSTCFLDGMLDEVKIFDDELTSTDVTNLYNSGTGLFYPF